MSEEHSVSTGFDFVTRRALVEAAKKLAASDGSSVDLYRDLLTETGKLFGQSFGIECHIQMTIAKDELEQAIERAEGNDQDTI